MKRLLAIFTAKHQPDRDALSAYLDGQLAPRRAAALEAHVASCAACTDTLEGMREVRTMLRALPEAAPPRSFRLRPSDVAAAGPAAIRTIGAPPPSLMRAMPVLAAAAVIVFAVALGLDITRDGNGGASRSAGLSAMTERTAAYAEDSASAGEAARNQDGVQNGPPAADDAPGGADSAPQPNVPAASTQMTAEAQPDVAAASAADDDDGNNFTFRIVEVAAAAVAIVAGGLAVRTWRKRREGVA